MSKQCSTQGGSCGCNCHINQCSSCGSHDHCECCHQDHKSHHEKQDFAQELLKMADEAWMEVLKEKIKEKIRSSSGPHLDQLATLVSESNKARWKGKMAANKSCSDFKEKVSELLCHE